MDVEWDPAKAELNSAKHGITFDEAWVVFLDPHHLEFDVSKPHHAETRGLAVGQLASGWIVGVIFTVRGDKHRIISARRARRDERRKYRANQGLA